MNFIIDINDTDYRIEVTRLHITVGSHSWNAPSDIDYHGGIEELEYNVYDMKGKLVDIEISDEDEERIQELVYDEYQRLVEEDERDRYAY